MTPRRASRVCQESAPRPTLSKISRHASGRGRISRVDTSTALPRRASRRGRGNSPLFPRYRSKKIGDVMLQELESFLDETPRNWTQLATYGSLAVDARRVWAEGE